jgi:hypothetical protein
MCCYRTEMGGGFLSKRSLLAKQKLHSLCKRSPLGEKCKGFWARAIRDYSREFRSEHGAGREQKEEDG